MARRPRAKTDPFEREIEVAFQPGAFIPDGACFAFVTGLEEIATKIAGLIGSEPARTVALYETFLAGCYEKIEELDDSSGCFGQFVEGLYCGWVKARQEENADPDETASRLLGWMDADSYGLCYQLEKSLVRVLDRANLAALATRVRTRFDSAATATAGGSRTSSNRPEYVRRRWSAVLRALHIARKDVKSYIALTQETELTAEDCHAIGTLLVGRRKPDEALSWIDRGIELDKKTPHGSWAGHDLAKLRRELLARLGRGNEARDAAWADYCAYPSRYTYNTLMKFVPRADRPKWHAKAIEAARETDLYSLLDLLLATKEMARLADLVRRASDQELEDLSHYATEPVAKKFEKSHPDLAGRLWRAQGMRIINARKSKYYRVALSNFKHAKRCFERAGLAAAWEATVTQVRADHHRKTGFLSGFENLLAGEGPGEEPSFLKRAKAGWNKRAGRSR